MKGPIIPYHFKELFFPFELPWCLCWKSIDRKYEGLFLDFQFHFPFIYVYLYGQYHTVIMVA